MPHEIQYKMFGIKHIGMGQEIEALLNNGRRTINIDKNIFIVLRIGNGSVNISLLLVGGDYFYVICRFP